jgi:hypothetical protein
MAGGLKTAEYILSILWLLLWPLLLAVIPVWLALKLRDRLKVKSVAVLKELSFRDLVTLYTERVPDHERVPPDHFKAFFNSNYSSKSARDFRRRVKENTIPAHLLLIAKTSHGICGFLKAIYVPGIQCLFVAYIVSSAGNTHPERNVTDNLLSTLLKICKGSAVRFLVCEFCHDGKTRGHEAKARLFRDYARAQSLQLLHIDARYVQPEICSFDTGDCNVTNAELYIVPLDGSFHKDPRQITKAEYQQLVSGIYKHVYFSSYVMAEPDLKEKYRDFIERLSTNLFTSISTDIIDLR